MVLHKPTDTVSYVLVYKMCASPPLPDESSPSLQKKDPRHGTCLLAIRPCRSGRKIVQHHHTKIHQVLRMVKVSYHPVVESAESFLPGCITYEVRTMFCSMFRFDGSFFVVHSCSSSVDSVDKQSSVSSHRSCTAADCVSPREI